MDLKEGMYVRTKGGFIDKIISFKSTISNDYAELEDEYYANKKDILKASNNIIDLIEVGDIITYEFPTGLGMLKYENVTVLENLLDILKNSDEYTILSIVTKEQFESMSYKVGD